MFYGQITENIKSKYDLNSVKLLIYNAYVIIPVSLIITFFSGELINVIKYDKVCFGFIFYLILSCLLTAILNASYFISNEANSSLFTQLCSNCKDIFITIIGYMMLSDFSFTVNTSLGMILSTLGATVFSFKTILSSIKKTNKDEEKNK
jgi:uncharacterized membrane protein